MSVYNGEKYLGEAIESILNQTFSDFEFLIIDDGSKDNSLHIIKSYDDDRIRLVVNEKNIGQSATLNKGIQIAFGKYIARMDQDDISAPMRLMREVDILNLSPEIGLVSTNYYVINANGFISETPLLKKTLTGGEVEWRLFWGNPIVHPSVMYRSELVKLLSGYSENYSYHLEDYVLWFRFLEISKVTVIKEPLFYLRKHDLNATKIVYKLHLKEINKATRHVLMKRLLCEVSPESIDLIRNSYNGISPSFSHVRMALVILINAYKYLIRKYPLNTHQKRYIQSDLFNRIIRVIKQPLSSAFP